MRAAPGAARDARGASSSPTRRTSCGRRSSRSAASSSCSRTRSSTSATRREFLVTMQEQVERLTRLATDLLDLSRLDAGRFARRAASRSTSARSPRRWRTSSRAVARASEHPLEVGAEARAAAALWATSERVLQIGRMLVENALRHTPPGTPRAGRASGARRARPRSSVEDDGPRDPARSTRPRLRALLPRRRRRGRPAAARPRDRAGARARCMGGELELESRPGQDAAFSLVLPAARRRRGIAAAALAV